MFLLASIVMLIYFMPIFINWLIDKDSSELTSDETDVVSKLIEGYYADFLNLEYKDMKKYFYGENVNIKIKDGSHPLTDYGKSYYGNIDSEDSYKKIASNYKQHMGDFIKKEFASMEFVLQPYDYPIGNIFFAELRGKYQNYESYENFFIQKDCLLIYEHIIYIKGDIE